MTTRYVASGQFKTTFRADCLTEKINHLSIPGNENHEVEIERTQRSYMG
jgi:hypothetical protein